MSKQVQTSRSPIARQVGDAAGRTLDILAMLFNADDENDNRVIVLVWDVTALVDLQARYEQQRTMATIGALVAGVAHEVRNPLFAVSATLDAMEQSSDGKLSEYFEVLRDEIERMSVLMRDLLAYGRPSAPRLSTIPVGEVVAQAIRNTAAVAQKGAVQVQANIVEDRAVVVDRERFARALQNLIENSIQHSPAGGVVTVDVKANPPSRPRQMLITISDQGRGFREEDLPRVFEPFYSKRKGGTGLGLALVQQIVTEHGGEVVASNAPGGGAAVTITIPLPR